MIDEGEGSKLRLEEGDDKAGEIVCDLMLPGLDKPVRNVRIRFPMGMRARAYTGREVDALAIRDGNLLEVLAAVDREATSELTEEIAPGESQFHSTDPTPQIISILSSLIKIGRNATKFAVREDDIIGIGTITITVGPPVAGPPPTFPFTISYQDNAGAVLPVVLGPFTVFGVAPQGVTNFRLRGKAETFSSLVKIE